MSNMLKHVGEIANTSKRCAVVFLQLPEDPGFALVIDTETIPPRFHQPLMEVIESNEGQSANSLADILARRIMPETGQTMLQTFHQAGCLQKVTIDNVNLMPRPNVKHPLREVLVAMGKATSAPKPVVSPDTANFYQQQAQDQNADQKRSVAEGLLQQAGLLQADADRLREQAYAQVPSLRPGTVGTPVQVTAIPADPVSVSVADASVTIATTGDLNITSDAPVVLTEAPKASGK